MELPGPVGWILLGWGVFNLVEGILDHHILAIHHVRSGENQRWWDVGFLVLGALLVACGWFLQRSGRPVDTGERASGAAAAGARDAR